MLHGDAPHLKRGHLTKRLFRVTDMVLGRQNQVSADQLLCAIMHSWIGPYKVNSSMSVNLDIDPNEMVTVPTDIWTKRFKLSVSVSPSPVGVSWVEGSSTKLTSQIMSEARDFTEI